MSEPKKGPAYYPTPPSVPQIRPPDTMHVVLSEVRGMRRDVDTLVGNFQSVSEWRGEVEQWRADVNAAVMRNSNAVKQPSQHDLAAQAKVAALEGKVARIEEKTDQQTRILENLQSKAEKFLANPLVRIIATSAGTAIAAWLASHGGHS